MPKPFNLVKSPRVLTTNNLLVAATRAAGTARLLNPSVIVASNQVNFPQGDFRQARLSDGNTLLCGRDGLGPRTATTPYLIESLKGLKHQFSQPFAHAAAGERVTGAKAHGRVIHTLGGKPRWPL